MIKKIAHISDIHIRKSIKRHEEYSKVFQTLYDSLREEKPDRIVIAGDLYHDYIDLEGEAQILMASFLQNLSEIAPVKITRGNHDMRKSALTRMDVVETITKLINNPLVEYYSKSGFYTDENVTFVVFHHRSDVKDPWVEIPHKRVKDQTYIDLFHDPVNGCLSSMGTSLKGEYISVDNFKGDISMFGDIHLYQSFSDGTKAYSSSLIQQNFGETPDKHGYLIWDIDSKSHRFIEIDNDHVYINFEVGQNTDYNNLKLTSPFIKKENEIKVKWCDISSNVTKENENKIKQYLLETFNAKIVKIEKNPVLVNLVDGTLISDSVDMNDKNVVREIFTEYLKNNKYSDEFINDVLVLDNIINDRIEVTEHESLEWKICSVWFDNFKSYGDNNQIEYSDLNGVTKISGLNQQGKTTLLDIITYINYGKTIGTESKEKFGDSRFINNKRNLDYCEAGEIIKINDQFYTIVRRTERKWDAKKTKVTGCSTKVSYYLGSEIKEENKINDETKDRTAKLISKALGSFDDFVRLVLTTGDNLNSLLASDRSNFIDAIIKDAGYDIFEAKLNELKNYLASLNEEKVVLTISDEEEKIENKKIDLERLEASLNELTVGKEELVKQIEVLNSLKESEIKKLHKIDESVININFDSIERTKTVLTESIQKNTSEISSLIESNKNLPDDFDQSKFVEIDNLIASKNKEISAIDVSAVELKSEINSLLSKKIDVDRSLQSVIEKENTILDSKIREYQLRMDSSKKSVTDLVSKYTDNLNIQIQKIKSDISVIDIELAHLKEKALDAGKTKTELEGSTTCVACGQEMGEEHFKHVKENIDQININVKKWKDEWIEKNEVKKVKTSEIQKLEIFLTEIKDRNFSSNQELKDGYDKAANEYKQLKGEVEQFISKKSEITASDYKSSPAILEAIEKSIADKKNLEIEKQTIESKLENLKSKKDLINTDLIVCAKDKSLLMEEQSRYNLKIKNLSTISKLQLDNSNLNNKVEENKRVLEKYESNLSSIEANKLINLEILKYNQSVSDVTIKVKQSDSDILEINKTSHVLTREISEIESRIVKFKDQQKKDEIRKVYKSSVHRDGLPTYLLKKSIGIINTELNNLLTDVDFTLFFDENLNLKLCSDKFEHAWQNAVDSSGKERTFSAIALKMALRKINNRSKPDMLIFDEVTGKLLGESVEQFVEFLDRISKEIGKVLIIEHVHPIMYDHEIKVEKSDDGISKLTIV